MHPPRITDLRRSDLRDLVAEAGEPAFRADQIWQWITTHGVTVPGDMTNIPLPLRSALEQRTHCAPLREDWRRDSVQTTEKMLLELGDGEAVEAVLILEGERTTACLSTQVGCPVGCGFCASAQLGLRRNLSRGEILDQFLAVRRRARDLDRRLSNVVMMGMGEPMLNMKATLEALQVINDPDAGAIGARHLTISTVGLKKGLDQLRREGRQYTLAISLHAPNDEIRRRLIPFPGALPVNDLVREARDYFDATGREVTFEYVTLSTVNDSPACARELGMLLRGTRCTLNIIPYNENPGLNYRRPAMATVDTFAAIVRQAGVKVSVRKQKGDSILAACGQLRLREQKSPDCL